MSRARRSTSWQVGGEAMHSLLYPVCNEREAMRRQGLQPKDHAKENVRRIQELQRQKAQVCPCWSARGAVRVRVQVRVRACRGARALRARLPRTRRLDAAAARASRVSPACVPPGRRLAAWLQPHLLPACGRVPRTSRQRELQRPQTDPEPFKLQRFKDTTSQVRRWIQEEGYLHQQGVAADGGRGAMPTQRPASAGGYIRKGEGQRRGPSCRESMLEVRGIADVDRRQKVPAAARSVGACARPG